MESNLEPFPERRRCLRQKVHAPAFASFDGVTGGMILDLSEEGLAMQTDHRFDHRTAGINSRATCSLEPGRRVRLELDLHEAGARITPSKLETTGYIAWADALGRAGVSFSELPEAARRRLNQWLAVNASTPSRTAPKVALSWPGTPGSGPRTDESGNRNHLAISLEADTDAAENGSESFTSTVQYEFSSLGTDLPAALRLIGERARSLTRGTSAAIALAQDDAIICRASVGASAPALGSRLDLNSGLSGECFRGGKPVRCDDALHDPRVDLESCRRLGVRSIVAAPVRYERDTIGLLMVLAAEPFNFDEGDVAVVNSLAHTIVRSMRQSQPLRRGFAAG